MVALAACEWAAGRGAYLMSFERLAPFYRAMERVLAGGKLQHCRTVLLPRLGLVREVLVVGEGPGRGGGLARGVDAVVGTWRSALHEHALSFVPDRSALVGFESQRRDIEQFALGESDRTLPHALGSSAPLDSQPHADIVGDDQRWPEHADHDERRAAQIATARDRQRHSERTSMSEHQADQSVRGNEMSDRPNATNAHGTSGPADR